MMIPPPPKRPLSEPGDVLEGQVIWTSQAVDGYGHQVLDIRLQTSSGPVQYRCPERLWRQLSQAVGTADTGRIRITRGPDQPSTGGSRPMRTWVVELLPDPIIPTAPPAPARTGPAW